MSVIAVGSQWVDAKGRTFEVVEKHPFGKVTVKQLDRAYFGTISHRALRETSKPKAATN